MSFLKKSSFAVCAAVGTGCAIVLTALLLLPFAWAVQRQWLPQQGGWLYAAGCAFAAVLVPTAVIARTRRRQAMATGGVLSLAYVALVALLCALGGKNCAFGLWLAALAAAALAGGMAGAVLSIRQNTHKKRRR